MVKTYSTAAGRIALAMVAMLWLAGPARAVEFTSLGSLHPQAVVPKFVEQKSPVRVIRRFEVSPGLKAEAVLIPGQCSTSYEIPAGQRRFSGILAYSAADPSAANPAAEYNRIRTRILVDGRELFRANLDKNTPPEEFSVPLDGGRILSIKTDGEVSWDRVYLANARFGPDAQPSSRHYVLAAGIGYVDLTPEPRQLFFHVFRPGEKVAAGAFCGGAADAAQVTVEVRPESGARALSTRVAAGLSAAGPALAGGRFSWQVPDVRGPAQVSVREEVRGQTVYETGFRIAIAPEVDLARISDSPFGVHLSGWGFSFLADDLASLWGAKWGRVFVRWDFVEPQPGSYDFARMDELIDLYVGQHMRILGVLGEKMPAWAATPGPEQYAAFRKFVEATVRRYRGKIEYWDLFNEIDNKRYHLLAQAYKNGAAAGAENADLEWLRAIIAGVRSADPQARTVGCSTGSSGRFLPYHQRVFDAGLLKDLDIVALHPYMHVAPELKDGTFTFLGQIDALEELVGRYHTTKPIWSTEANYILGRAGEPDVTVPGMDEHTQAEFVVRTNLLACAGGVHYFLHSPFNSSHRRELHLDTLAAYAQMTSMFSDATDVKLLGAGGKNIYAIAGRRAAGLVGALWTPLAWARARLGGLSGIEFFDLYGNRVAQNSDELRLSGTPLYYLARSPGEPSITLLDEAPIPPWQPLPPWAEWKRGKDSVYEERGGRLHVVTGTTTYGHQLISAPMAVEPHARYVFRIDARVLRGTIFWAALDAVSHKRVRSDAIAVLMAQGDQRPREVELTVETGDCRSLRLVVAAANSVRPDQDEFEVSDPQFRREP